ncbi:MAG: gliding motility-associated C-terminal domain-containing protein [Lentimicrobiaceae bacterium]|nr:gliding motility-associated C-terminal domain-containing protein [Lentimicrobiaceae bacterium]
MRNVFLGVLLFFAIFSANATHERAGEITYRHISGRTYEFTITTYTYSPSPANRLALPVDWGDGTIDTIPRITYTNLPSDIRHNIYMGQHTFPAAGTYTVSMEDPDRNQGIVNIPNSVNVPFYIETTIIINPFLTPNNSPVLTNPPIDLGCVGVPFYHNPIAVDPDGDSLAYSLVECRGFNGDKISGYSFPLYSNSLSIDAQTGDFYWDSPVWQGEYNIAILIQEYRNGIKIGELVRDMQITIAACNNEPPKITIINDTCIEAGNVLNFKAIATDASEKSLTLALSADGEVFRLEKYPATFADVTKGEWQVESTFNWNTHCVHVRRQPYYAVFKATSEFSPTISLVSMKTLRITVVSPAPQNLQAYPMENTVVLSWNHTSCNGYATGYKIYRRIDSSGYIPDYCETGVPDYTGYTHIGTTDINTTTFIDDNNGNGLLRGTKYCYLAIAYFPDNAESYASNEACVFLKKDVPIITNVSILQTHHLNGMVELKWLLPTEIDSLQYQGPYYYTISRSLNNISNFVPIATLNDITETQFIDSLQNTESNTFFYRINLYNNTTAPFLMGSSDIASSVFLVIDSTDRMLKLKWSETVPWENTDYVVYRDEGSGFDSIGITSEQYFNDAGLINKQTYCYYIKSIGAYSDTAIPAPLINLSQQVCSQPIDNQPPCVPNAWGETDCENIYLHWDFSDTCTDYMDMYKLYIYYKPDLQSNYARLDSVLYPSSDYVVYQPKSIIGCFAVSTIDLAGNESKMSNSICFDADKCGSYRLPNVFTPNGYGANYLFRPFPYDFVENVNMHIYNRWGMLVFKTTNPDILWDGKNQWTKQDCPDGVYYYTCDVQERTLQGLRTRHLNGSITIFRNRSNLHKY